MSQPSFEEMVAYVLNEVDPSRADEIRRSLAGSAESSATLDRIRRLLDTFRTDDTAVPGRAAIDRAKSLMTPKVAPAARWWARAVECAAALVFDSRAQTAVAGFRGGSMGRQLAYTCEFGEIDLSVSDTPDGAWAIRGQIDAAGTESPGSIALFAPGAEDPAIQTTPDSTGQFKLRSSLPACDLKILFGDRVVALGPVQLE